MILLCILLFGFNSEVSNYCKGRTETNEYCRKTYPIRVEAGFYLNRSDAIKDYRKYAADNISVRLYEVSISSGIKVKEVTPPMVDCAIIEEDIRVW